MSAYRECWIKVASDLFQQALSGEPKLVEWQILPEQPRMLEFTATLAGEESGQFSVSLEEDILNSPLLGEGVDQHKSWKELLREVFDAAAGELLARRGKECSIQSVSESSIDASVSQEFKIQSGERSWTLLLRDKIAPSTPRTAPSINPPGQEEQTISSPSELKPSFELLLDVELEASLRFGCREMALGEILDLGPGDVVQLDRHVAEPVDLIVGDKIVGRGEVVLVNGNFGIRVSEVATPVKRLESIRCLF